jgi:hypothetical protein
VVLNPSLARVRGQVDASARSGEQSPLDTTAQDGSLPMSEPDATPVDETEQPTTDHAEPTEQPDEDEEPQAGSPS